MTITRPYAREIVRTLLEEAYARGGFHKGELSSEEMQAVKARVRHLKASLKNIDDTKPGRWEFREAELIAIRHMLLPAML